jgi:hypothetical protein
MDAAPGRRLQRRSSANILTAWPGRVAQAPAKSGSRARSLVLLTMLAPVVENRTGQGSTTALDDEANLEIADRYTVGS